MNADTEGNGRTVSRLPCCSCQLARFPAIGVRPSPGAAASISRQALVSLGALTLPTLLRPRMGALRHPNTISRSPAPPASLRVSLPPEHPRPPPPHLP